MEEIRFCERCGFKHECKVGAVLGWSSEAYGIGVFLHYCDGHFSLRTWEYDDDYQLVVNPPLVGNERFHSRWFGPLGPPE